MIGALGPGALPISARHHVLPHWSLRGPSTKLGGGRAMGDSAGPDHP